MEIIELKLAWNLLQQDVINNDMIEENKIMTSIHSKSKSDISKIKRGLLLKLVIALLSIVVIIGFAIVSISNPALNPFDFIFSPIKSIAFFLILALSISIVAYFNYKAYTKIKAVQLSSFNLKDNLKIFIDAMKTAITFNILSDTFMTPIIFTWVYYAYSYKNHQFAFDLKTILLFIYPILIGIISFFIQKYVQNLKFGKYLKRLSGYSKNLQKKSSEL